MTSFQGVVTDEDKHPLSGATVTLNEMKTVTDSDGRFTLQFIESEYYWIRIGKKRFYERFHTFSHDELDKLSSKASFELMKKKEKRIMLAFAGDVMMGRRYYQPYFDDPILIKPKSILEDSKSIVEHIKPYMSIADVNVVNLESQLTEKEPESKTEKLVLLTSAPETVQALLWAGIDYVSLGNNHTYDYLDHGLDSTLRALDAFELHYSGAGHTEEAALKPYEMSIANQQLALLSYVGWEGRSTIKQTANQSKGGAAFGNKRNIENGVTNAVEKGMLPVVQYHGSLEYQKEPTGVTEHRLKEALDAGAVLCIGHHPHVTQGLELYDDKLIAYSMGNFISDQNFSCTQNSFILYVWLDDGVFKKAEIVPIYLKGYKPTPALDQERYSVLNRIKVLSEKRNTRVTNYLGHGVVLPRTSDQVYSLARNEYQVSFKTNTSNVLPLHDWSEKVEQIITPSKDIRYRLGTNLVNGSSFEHFNWFGAQERGFLLPSTWNLNSDGYKSQYSLAVIAKKDSNNLLGMKYFRSVYRKSTPVTFASKIRTEQPIKLNIYWQGRGDKGQKLLDALSSSPKQLIKSIDLQANNNEWQTLEVDFFSPKVGYRSYRVLVEVVNNSAEDKHVLFDNFDLIEWQTSFQNSAVPLRVNDNVLMATHIGVNKNVDVPILLRTQGGPKKKISDVMLNFLDIHKSKPTNQHFPYTNKKKFSELKSTNLPTNENRRTKKIQ